MQVFFALIHVIKIPFSPPGRSAHRAAGVQVRLAASPPLLGGGVAQPDPGGGGLRRPHAAAPPAGAALPLPAGRLRHGRAPRVSRPRP